MKPRTTTKRNSGKDPSFQFYWKDWLSDTRLLGIGASAKGVWVDIMCISMDMPTKGVLHDGRHALTQDDLANKLTGDQQENKAALACLIDHEILKTVPDGPLAGAYYVKRLYHDMRLREIRIAAGKQGGNPALLNQIPNHPANQNATPSSSSSSSASTPPIAPPTGACVSGDLFNRFWSAYPKKRAKDAAKRSFAKRKPDEALLARMLAAIEAQKRTDDWKRESGRYIPHPATWINDGRWADEVGQSCANKASREIVHKCYVCGKQRPESQMKRHPQLTSERVCQEHDV